MRAKPTIIAIIIFALLGAVMVMQRLRITQLGYDLGRVNSEIRRLKEDIRNYEISHTQLYSREGIDSRVRYFKLPLLPPEEVKAEVKSPRRSG